nr:hypothetical protein CFP56_59394 [Quercus suber]
MGRFKHNLYWNNHFLCIFGQVEKQLPHKSGALNLTIDVLYREAAFWKPEASCGSDNDDSVALAVHLVEVNDSGI